MKIRELIDILKKENPDQEVMIADTEREPWVIDHVTVTSRATHGGTTVLHIEELTKSETEFAVAIYLAPATTPTPAASPTTTSTTW